MKRERNIAVAVLAGFILVAVILLAAFYLQKPFNPAPTPVISVIVDGNFTVNSDSYVYYNLRYILDLQTPKLTKRCKAPLVFLTETRAQ
jgi:hypothetical protein